MVDDVAEDVVPTDTVTSTAANQGMVAEPVEDAVASGAEVVLFGEGHAESAL